MVKIIQGLETEFSKRPQAEIKMDFLIEIK